MLNQLFNRGVLGARCKTCLHLSISRIKLLQNKRDAQLKQMRKEIAQFLQTGQEAIARIRVEHVVREQNLWATYEILEMFCEFLLARVPILESQRECPPELREAVASIIFAAPCCSDLPDLLQVKNLFTAKYGKEFVSAVSELRPDTSVNRTIIEKLSVSAPSALVKLRLLKEIAQEYNVYWDSSETEVEFSKKHDDLLDGSKPIREGALQQKLLNPSASNPTQLALPPCSEPSGHGSQSSSHTSTTTLLISNKTIESNKSKIQEGQIRESQKDMEVGSSDILEKARAAIASAERASVAARAAARLVNAKFGSLKLQNAS